MQQSNVTWVLIGDAARARLFEAADQGQKWNLIREFEHPQSRFANHDLVTDRPGRTQQSGGSNGQTAGGRSAMEPPTDPKTEEHILFAHELAGELEKGLKQNQYTHLVLAAGPHFLGMLRDSLGAQVKKHLTASVDKDYTHMPARELQQRFSGIVPE